MKKTLILLSAISLFIGSANLYSFAIDTNKERGQISVNTYSEKEIAPDLAEISFAIKTYDTKSIQNATLANNKISEKVLNNLKLFINESEGDYIKTSDFNATPIYSYINSKKTFEKYEVSNRIIVRTKSIDKLGQIIDQSIKEGATNVDNLSFSLSNYEKYCNELISDATKKAKNRAETTAKAISSNLEGIHNISTSCNLNNANAPRLYMAKNMIADTASSSTAEGLSTSISNGIIKVIANVNASFFVK